MHTRDRIADLEVVFQDDRLLVINKPSGMLSVPGTKGIADAQSLIKSVIPQARVVHRLDQETSGLLVLAFDKPAEVHLKKQFEQRSVEKVYIAVVQGTLERYEGEIDLALAAADQPPLQQVDQAKGKPSKTRYHVVEEDDLSSRVKLQPLTGRTHQLRVHMQAIGHPILGDQLYGNQESKNAAQRLLLHAYAMRFSHPEKDEPLELVVECPF